MPETLHALDGVFAHAAAVPADEEHAVENAALLEGGRRRGEPVTLELLHQAIGVLVVEERAHLDPVDGRWRGERTRRGRRVGGTRRSRRARGRGGVCRRRRRWQW